jgi:hypothetical protein
VCCEFTEEVEVVEEEEDLSELLLTTLTIAVV